MYGMPNLPFLPIDPVVRAPTSDAVPQKISEERSFPPPLPAVPGEIGN
jgi:hypothetical protein